MKNGFSIELLAERTYQASADACFGGVGIEAHAVVFHGEPEVSVGISYKFHPDIPASPERESVFIGIRQGFHREERNWYSCVA
jgi:hypothetical protein